MTHTFEIKDNFYLDGKPFQIISGGKIGRASCRERV